MSAGSRRQVDDFEDSIIARDKDDLPVILVETHSMKDAARLGVPQLLEHLGETDVPFGMFADLEGIRIFRGDAADPSSPLCTFVTADVLSHYDPGFRDKRIFSNYLDALIEAWLRDFAYHWKSERPPGAEEMTALGLSERLAGGTTGKGRALGDPPLY